MGYFIWSLKLIKYLQLNLKRLTREVSNVIAHLHIFYKLQKKRGEMRGEERESEREEGRREEEWTKRRDRQRYSNIYCFKVGSLAKFTKVSTTT